MSNETVMTAEKANNDMEKARNSQYYRPNVDVVEQGDELLLLVDLPGVVPGEIDIDFKDNVLALTGRVESRQSEDTKYLLHEFGVGDFYRTFQISDDIDASRITAEFHDGVLTLHLPKVEAVKPRKINVQVS